MDFEKLRHAMLDSTRMADHTANRCEENNAAKTKINQSISAAVSLLPAGSSAPFVTFVQQIGRMLFFFKKWGCYCVDFDYDACP
jgi:hypothetical protein